MLKYCITNSTASPRAYSEQQTMPRPASCMGISIRKVCFSAARQTRSANTCWKVFLPSISQCTSCTWNLPDSSSSRVRLFILVYFAHLPMEKLLK